jgi:hypothetical protein
MIRGWVYVLSNKAMPDIVKIGYSTKEATLRADELEGTGLPHPFVVEYNALVVDPRDVEQQVHKRLREYREGKEFFRIAVSQAIECIRQVASMQKKMILLEISNPVQEGIGAYGSRVEGEYACQGGLLDSIKLESGGKADVRETYLGQKMEKTATYTVDGSKVTVVLDGQSAVFTLSSKTLAGGDTLGTCTAK